MCQIYNFIVSSQEFSMKTVSAVRFKPKPECYDEFLEECKKRSAWRREHPNVLQRIIACSDKEVIEITIIDDLEFVLEKQESDLTWLDGLRHMLEEYNEQDRHTLPISGLIIDE